MQSPDGVFLSNGVTHIGVVTVRPGVPNACLDEYWGLANRLLLFIHIPV